MKQWFPLPVMLVLAAVSTPAKADFFGYLANAPEQTVEAPAPVVVDDAYQGATLGTNFGYPFRSGCCESKTTCSCLWAGYCSGHPCHGFASHGKGGCAVQKGGKGGPVQKCGPTQKCAPVPKGCKSHTKLASPKFQMPKLPKVHMPKVHSPAQCGPKHGGPVQCGPKLHSPKLAIPKFEWPKFSCPTPGKGHKSKLAGPMPSLGGKGHSCGGCQTLKVVAPSKGGHTNLGLFDWMHFKGKSKGKGAVSYPATKTYDYSAPAPGYELQPQAPAVETAPTPAPIIPTPTSLDNSAQLQWRRVLTPVSF